MVKKTGPVLMPGAFKGWFELQYWKSRCGDANAPLWNAHYESLYTEVFDLRRSDYDGKRVLDIGCGPRGSLEWADMTAQRVGLDPLVPGYLKLGADKHKMEYVASRSENIPFPDGHFDVVACLNALDHVDDLNATIREIKRVSKPGGTFLLSVEVDHPPTPTEPITINENTLRKLSPEFERVSEFRVGTPGDHDLHRAVTTRLPAYVAGEPGIYVARYRRS
jgi:2-polyprenyl-3-methyl-5-hydroxy-6-metoxy-1,4-benzoquinol methylase